VDRPEPRCLPLPSNSLPFRQRPTRHLAQTGRQLRPQLTEIVPGCVKLE